MGLLAYRVSEANSYFVSLSGFWIFLNLVAAGYPKWAANLPLDVQKYGSSHIKRQEVWELSHGTTKSVGALTLIAMKKCIQGDSSPWARNYLFWSVFDWVWPLFLMVNFFLKFRSIKVQKCGSSCLKRTSHVFKCKARGLFEKLIESSTETAPSRGSSIEKSNWAKASRNLIAHNYGSFRFRRSKVWELSIGALNPCFQVQSFRTFSEIGRELHRSSTFNQKLYGKSAIEQRLGNFLLDPLIARHVKTEAPRVFQGQFFKVRSSTCLFW